MIFVKHQGVSYPIKDSPREFTLREWINVTRIPLHHTLLRFRVMNPLFPEHMAMFLLEQQPAWMVDLVENLQAQVDASALKEGDELYGQGPDGAYPTVSDSMLRKCWDSLNVIESAGEQTDLEVGAKVYSHYFNLPVEQVYTLRLDVVYPAIIFLFEDFARFYERFKVLGQQEPEELMVRAGVKGLDQYGRLATLLNLIRYFGAQKEYILDELEAGYVYVCLQFMMDVEKVKENYMNLKAEEAERNAKMKRK